MEFPMLPGWSPTPDLWRFTHLGLPKCWDYKRAPLCPACRTPSSHRVILAPQASASTSPREASLPPGCWAGCPCSALAPWGRVRLRGLNPDSHFPRCVISGKSLRYSLPQFPSSVKGKPSSWDYRCPPPHLTNFCIFSRDRVSPY